MYDPLVEELRRQKAVRLLVPLFFVSIARLFGMDKKKPGGEPPAQEPPVDGVPA